MIHPQYIIAYIDCNQCEFRIIERKKLVFEICFYSKDIKILYKIKQRFKTGKVIKLKDKNILKITKQLETVLLFFYNNKPLSIQGNINFYRFSYLYQKIESENNTIKTEKEKKKIKKRLTYFGDYSEQIYSGLF